MDSSNSPTHAELPVERTRRRFWTRIVWASAASLALIALVGECTSLFLYTHGGANYAWLVKLPATRDRRLVGEWIGPTENPLGGQPVVKTLILSPDGTARDSLDEQHTKPFEWGTEDGLLYFREFDVDAWGGSTFPYKLSADGQRASFSKIEEFGPVAPEMHLQSSPSEGQIHQFP